MKHVFKSISSLLLTLIMLLSFSSVSFAADATITFKSISNGFGFAPGSNYTETDLFKEFKDVMPGDTLSETVQIENIATDCDYIKLYIKADIHDETNNPLTYSETFENTDGNDQTNVAGVRDETIAAMHDFLSKLTMRIYNESNSRLIYESSPDTAGALTDYVLIATLKTNESMTLKVELDVPITLDNTYANRVGEVDWVFKAECFTHTKNDTSLTVHKIWKGDTENIPDSITVQLLRDGKAYGDSVKLTKDNQWTYTWTKLSRSHKWSIEEINVPTGYTASYTTKGNKVTITNTSDEVIDEEPSNTPKSLTVTKKWDDKNADKRPDSASITLCNGSNEIETVLLGDWNGWTYTWTELDGNGDWCIIESNIPKGYTPVYSAVGNTITVTNTEALIQTGQLNWPIPVLGGLGALMIALGIVKMRNSKKENEV